MTLVGGVTRNGCFGSRADIAELSIDKHGPAVGQQRGVHFFLIEPLFQLVVFDGHLADKPFAADDHTVDEIAGAPWKKAVPPLLEVSGKVSG